MRKRKIWRGGCPQALTAFSRFESVCTHRHTHVPSPPSRVIEKHPLHRHISRWLVRVFARMAWGQFLSSTEFANSHKTGRPEAVLKRSKQIFHRARR